MGYSIKILSISVFIALVLGLGGGYWIGRKVTSNIGTDSSTSPGSTVAAITTTLSGTVKSIGDGKITLDSGWVINVESGAQFKYPSGMAIAMGDIKTGMQISSLLNSPQKPGTINSSELKSITVVPSAAVSGVVAVPTPLPASTSTHKQ